MTVNILIMIHGMIPNEDRKSHFKEYNDFWNAIVNKRRELQGLFESSFTHPDNKENLSFIGVEWGHKPPNSQGNLRDDQKLTCAQNFVNERVSYNNVRQVSEPNNSTFFDFPLFIPGVRNVVFDLRETIVTRGFGDVIYYTSYEGETRIRYTVYDQILQQLDPYLDKTDVRIHLIGQSLGVTLTHDFLYGLFNQDPCYHPDFVDREKPQGSEESVRRFNQWREKGKNGELKLGSLTSTASQLPLFVMRKQKMVDRLANGDFLEASKIGIVNSNKVKWKIFYDIDDAIGFATRRLYDSDDAIMDIQVNSSDNPKNAHTKYWENQKVIEKTANLLLENAQ